MKIEEYTLADLADRLESGNFWSGEIIPITKHRALSQLRNPRASSDDLCLLVAYDGDRVIGYIGVLPDLVFVNGEERRIGWLSAWWADPDPKYASIGLVLMVKAVRAYGGAVGASGFSNDAKKAYEASKLFLEVEEQALLKAAIRVNSHERLPRKFPRLAKAGPLFKTLDGFLNLFCDLRLYAWRSRSGVRQQFRVEYLAEVDTEAAQFIEDVQDKHETGLTRRGPAEINWIAKYPWVLGVPVGPVKEKRFYFSATARESSCFMAKISDGHGLMIGFVLLSAIDGQLTVPLCYMLPQHCDDVFRVIAEHAIALRAHTITIGREELRQSLTHTKLPCIAKVNRTSRWILGKSFGALSIDDFDLQDGDGDCAFWS